MSVVWWLQPTQTCSIQAVKAIGKSDIYLKIEIISKIFGLTLLCIAVFLFDTVIAIAFSMLIAQFVAVIIYGVHVSWYIGYKLKDQFKDLLVPALLGAIMCIPLCFVKSYIDTPIICLLLQGLIGGIIYISLSYFFKIEQFHYLLGLLKNRIKP